MRLHRLLTLSLCLSLAGCAAQRPFSAAPVLLGASARAQAPLRGHVDFPRSGLRSVLVTSDDVKGNAGVMLLDRATGRPLVSGVTDANGNFTFNPGEGGLDVQVGQIYQLDVVKQLPGVERILTLRTLVRRDAGQWTSLSGTDIIINLQTTALAEALSENLIDPEAAMGKLEDATRLTGIEGLSGAEFQTFSTDFGARKTSMQDKLTSDWDPVSLSFTASGNITVTTDAEMEAIANIEELKGNLTIGNMGGPPSSISQIRLPRLKRIQGSLIIFNCPNLADLSGFPRLMSIQGGLIVGSCHALTTTQGLDHLKEVPNGFLGQITGYFIDCPQLKDLKALSRLTEAKHIILDGTGHENLSALAGLKRLDGLALMNLPQLSSLVGLSPEVSLSVLSLWNLPELTSLGGIRFTPRMNSLGLSLLPKLESLEGLEDVTDLNGGDTSLMAGSMLHLSNLPQVSSLAPLSNLKTTRYLILDRMPQLRTLAPIAGLQQVDYLRLYYMPLEHLDGAFSNLSSLGRLECDLPDASDDFYLEMETLVQRLRSLTPGSPSISQGTIGSHTLTP